MQSFSYARTPAPFAAMHAPWAPPTFQGVPLAAFSHPLSHAPLYPAHCAHEATWHAPSALDELFAGMEFLPAPDASIAISEADVSAALQFAEALTSSERYCARSASEGSRADETRSQCDSGTGSPPPARPLRGKAQAVRFEESDGSEADSDDDYAESDTDGGSPRTARRATQPTPKLTQRRSSETTAVRTAAASPVPRRRATGRPVPAPVVDEATEALRARKRNRIAARRNRAIRRARFDAMLARSAQLGAENTKLRGVADKLRRERERLLARIRAARALLC